MDRVFSSNRSRTFLVVVVVVIVVVGFLSIYSLSGNIGLAQLLGQSPDDPDTDVIGWEDGYWHNEDIEISGDSLDENELEAVIARSKARLEVVRGFEYDADPGIQIISRNELKEQYNDSTHSSLSAYNVSENVKYEALFLIGQDENALNVTQSNAGNSVSGYYEFTTENITLVSDNGNEVRISEYVLLQELYHAHQDNRYDIGSWEYPTTDSYIAKLSVIEGDAVFTAHKYENKYDDLVETEPIRNNDSSDHHSGVYALESAPYTAGAMYVSSVYEENGWSGVNNLYSDPPTKTTTILHTNRSTQHTDTSLSYNTEPKEPWSVVTMNGTPVRDSVGEVGVYTMMWYPSYIESQDGERRTVVIPSGDFYVSPDGLERQNYVHPVSSGLLNDTLVPYVNTETNEIGYVWKLSWESSDDARIFTSEYTNILEYHGGEKINETTYELDTEQFDGVYTITRTNNIVVVSKTPALSQQNKLLE